MATGIILRHLNCASKYTNSASLSTILTPTVVGFLIGSTIGQIMENRQQRQFMEKFRGYLDRAEG